SGHRATIGRIMPEQQVKPSRVANLPETVRAALAAAKSRDEKLRRTVAAIKEAAPHYTWVGIYLLEGRELVLHSYIGRPTPHTRIPLDKGIRGAAVRENETLVIDDVNADPRYLACSVETRSEIVVPIRDSQGRAVGEIDLDSDVKAAFGADDRRALEAV